MPIGIYCVCGWGYPIADEQAGQQINCPACGRPLKVPGTSIAPAASAVQASQPALPSPAAQEGPHGPRLAPPTSDPPGASLLGSLAKPRLPMVVGGLIVALAIGTVVFVMVCGLLSTKPPPPAPVVQPAPPPVPPPPPVIVEPPAARETRATVAELIQMVQDPASPDWEKAVQELARRGPAAREALPALLRLVPRTNGAAKAACLTALIRLGRPEPADDQLLLPLLEDPAPAARLYALQGLASVSDAQQAALPSLSKLLGDRDAAVRRAAAALAGTIGKPARAGCLEGLLRLQADPNELNAQAAAAALAKVGLPTRADVPLLMKLATADTVGVRRHVLVYLTDLGGDAVKAIPVLVERVQREPVAELRRLALAALGRIGPSDKMVVDACTTALGDPDAEVARQAAAILAQAGQVAGALPGLLRALRHTDDEVSKRAGDALAGAKLDKSHVPAVAELLQKPLRLPARLRLLDLLEKLGADAGAALPALRGCLKDESDEVKVRALRLLGALGPVARETADEVDVQFKQGERPVRVEAALALVRIGAPQAVATVPFLVAGLLLDDLENKDRKAERDRMAEVLVKVGGAAVPRLLEALEKDFAALSLKTEQGVRNAEARLVVVQVLSQIGPNPHAQEALRVLVRVEARDPLPAVRSRARQARVEMQKERKP